MNTLSDNLSSPGAWPAVGPGEHLQIWGRPKKGLDLSLQSNVSKPLALLTCSNTSRHICHCVHIVYVVKAVKTVYTSVSRESSVSGEAAVSLRNDYNLVI